MNFDGGLLDAYYRSALLGLRGLEAGAGRHRAFGPDTEAKWQALRGELLSGDRLDLLIRNAAVSSPAAFAPRVVFGIPGLADDDPFGPEWPGPDEALARALIREAAAPLGDPSPKAILAEVARAWRLTPQPLDPKRHAAIEPQTRILTSGTGAILALVDRFAAGGGLDLAQQVLLLSASPGERQLFGLAAALLGATGPVRMLAPGDDVTRARALGFRFVNLALVSEDADPAARAAVEALARALGT